MLSTKIGGYGIVHTEQPAGWAATQGPLRSRSSKQRDPYIIYRAKLTSFSGSTDSTCVRHEAKPCLADSRLEHIPRTRRFTAYSASPPPLTCLTIIAAAPTLAEMRHGRGRCRRVVRGWGGVRVGVKDREATESIALPGCV